MKPKEYSGKKVILMVVLVVIFVVLVILTEKYLPLELNRTFQLSFPEPVPPTGLAVSPSSYDPTSCFIAQLGWNPAQDARGGVTTYNIYRDSYRLNAAAITSTYHADMQNLLGETTYIYQVSTVNEQGAESVLSDPVAYTTPPCRESAHLGERRIAVVLLHFADFSDTPFSLNYARNLVFQDTHSLKNYFEEVSFGRQTIVGEVYGWYSYSGNGQDYCSSLFGNGLWYQCDTQALLSEAITLVANDIDLGSVDEVIAVVQGMGIVGFAAQPWRFFSATNGFNLGIMAHEMGHGYGGNHAGLWDCGTGSIGTEVDYPFGTNCFVHAYGDGFDPMGVSEGHYSAVHKDVMGFTTPNQTLYAYEDGEYIITPLETSGGVKEVRIPISQSVFPHTFYTLEYRRPIGFDALLTVGAGDLVEGGIVRLHQDRFVTPNGTYNVNDRTLLISLNTGLFGMEFLITPEQPFIDPYRGISIYMNSMNEEEARFFIDVLESGCITSQDCEDNNTCTIAQCVEGVCEYTPAYGDVNHDGIIDVFDLLCMRDAFEGNFDECSLEDVDIAPCNGDGSVDIFDLFAFLDAFQGIDRCCGGLALSLPKGEVVNCLIRFENTSKEMLISNEMREILENLLRVHFGVRLTCR